MTGQLGGKDGERQLQGPRLDSPSPGNPHGTTPHGSLSVVPLAKAIEIGARLAMSEGCAFTGVSGDFDACSSLTRQVYEERSAQAFGVTLEDYYAMGDE